MTVLPVSHAVDSTECQGELLNVVIRHLGVLFTFIQSTLTYKDISKFSMSATFEWFLLFLRINVPRIHLLGVYIFF